MLTTWTPSLLKRLHAHMSLLGLAMPDFVEPGKWSECKGLEGHPNGAVFLMRLTPAMVLLMRPGTAPIHWSPDGDRILSFELQRRINEALWSCPVALNRTAWPPSTKHDKSMTDKAIDLLRDVLFQRWVLARDVKKQAYCQATA